MPLPKSMGACMRYVRRKHSGWSRKQRVAACLTAAGKSRKQKGG